jgi:Gamma-glutamyltransferase
MTKADLGEFQSEWIDPITTNYHGYDVFELPPPGQGFAALEMLNILEVCVPKFGTSLAALGPTDPQYWHYMVEAKKLAYSDLQTKNADPMFANVPVKELLSKEHARRSAAASIRTSRRSRRSRAAPTAAPST